MFGILEQRGIYSRLQGEHEAFSSHEKPLNRRHKVIQHAILAFIVIVLCTISVFTGYKLADRGGCAPDFDDVIPTAPLSGFRRQQVITDPIIQIPVPADGSSEPAWDELTPHGHGYVKHPELAPNISVIGVFHQLHCLYTIRRAYYAAHALSVGHKFNLTGVRDPDHVAHCFDYLQQTLTCFADDGIEPWYKSNRPDVMFGRRCRDFDEVKTWAAKWRVFGGRGYIIDAVHPGFQQEG